MSGEHLFDPSRIRLGLDDIRSAADAIRVAASLLAEGDPGGDEARRRIEEALLERESVASTATGRGVAFPHAKAAGLEGPRTALLTLAPPGVDMGASDGEPVRIVAALVVPEDAPGNGLGVLGAMARRFRDPGVREAVLLAVDGAAAARALDGEPA